jgi:hypothetical protein
MVRTGARTSTLTLELADRPTTDHGRRRVSCVGHLDAGGLGAVGLEEKKEEKCCTKCGSIYAPEPRRPNGYHDR